MDLSLIGLKESEPDINYEKDIKKKFKIDYNKKEFTEQEKDAIKKEVAMIKTKYPEYIPIVLRTKSKSNIKLNKIKYLVGEDITVVQFLSIIRKKIHDFNKSDSIFLFINNTLPVQHNTLGNLYKQYKDIDTHMLFVTVCKENTFG
jgi:hypothetical protein